VPFVISVNKDSHVYINDTMVETDKLEQKLTAIFKAKPRQKVFMKADKRVPYGTVMDVMSKVRGAGVEKLGMITEPHPEEKK
jgi:biopolymer transport protein TolR